MTALSPGRIRRPPVRTYVSRSRPIKRTFDFITRRHTCVHHIPSVHGRTVALQRRAIVYRPRTEFTEWMSESMRQRLCSVPEIDDVPRAMVGTSLVHITALLLSMRKAI